MISAVFLGVFFALQSGTLESVVYDTVLEETGDSESFERTIGRLRLVESIGLVTSALAGGLIAEFAPLRLTYFATAPLLLISAAPAPAIPRAAAPQGGGARAVARADRRHLPDDPRRRRHAGDRRPDGGRRAPHAGHARVRPAVARRAGGAAVPVRPALGGPHRRARDSAECSGAQPWFTRAWTVRGIAVGRRRLRRRPRRERPRRRWSSASRSPLTVIVVAVSIPVMRRLHDAVPSTIRAGVASGVGTLTWLAFVPFALAFGAVSESVGLDR